MSITPALLTPSAALPNATASFYTTPATGQTMVRRAVFTNTDTVPHTVTVNRVPSGGAAATANQVISAYRLAPGQAYVAVELTNMVLNGGDALYGVCDTAAKVNVTMSGITF